MDIVESKVPDQVGGASMDIVESKVPDQVGGARDYGYCGE